MFQCVALHLGLAYRGCANRHNACACVCSWDSAFLIGVCILVYINAREDVSVYICAKRENPSHGPIRVAERVCLLKDYGWSFLFHSFSEKQLLTDTLVPRGKSYDITAITQSLDYVFFCLKRAYEYRTHH